MTGDIYSRQKCPVCGSRLVHDPKRGGLFCADHPDQRATAKFVVKFGREVNKQFSSYDQAEYFLNGLRFKKYEGTFDHLDYRKDTPYAFHRLADDFLKEKAGMRNITYHMEKAKVFFKDMNVKHIRRRDIKAFLDNLAVSDKTRFNYRATLHHFFASYLVDEEILSEAPKFPEVEFELGYRNIIDLETQASVVDQVKKDTYAANPKIWFGVDMLRTYLSIRPEDLRRIDEKDMLVDQGAMIVWRPTKSKGRLKRRTVALLPEHVDFISEMKQKYPAMPNMPFFRWHGGESNNTKPGQAFGQRLLYDKWKEACNVLGLKGVDLYGGTRHSTTTALALEVGHDDAKQATEHGTNAAFDRYCQAQNATAARMSHVIKRMRGGGDVVVADVFTANKNR